MIEGDITDLVAREAVAGDEDAFHLLVRGHHSLVFRWALVVAADPDDAEDLAQAVWIKAWRNIGAFRHEAKFTSWLYRITFNTAVEFGRKRRRRVEIMRKWHESGDGNVTSEPARGAVDVQRLTEIVRTFLADLPPRQRAVFALADLDDVSTAEIAERLEIEEATVRVTLFRARRAIRAECSRNSRD